MLTAAVILFTALVSPVWASASFISETNIPRSHIPYFSKTESFRDKCQQDRHCQKHLRNSSRCWGYESSCSFESSYSYSKIECVDRSKRSVETFWEEGDFGKLRSVVSSLRPICKSAKEGGSYLECSDHLRFCRGKNIFFNFENLKVRTSKRYRNDVIRKGDVGGNCDSLYSDVLRSMTDEKSYLQSWGHELEFFSSYRNFKLDQQHCDVIFERPTIIIKLDAAVNMYHHFCDFINLYGAQHVNGSFDMNIDILWWDTFGGGFIDPFFGDTWKAFTKHRPIELISLDGKKVCFRSVLLSLLARQRLGLYYNMPLIKGCSHSGLFQAFSEHLLYRLGIKRDGTLPNQVKITLLSRSTKYRRIINEEEIYDALRALPNVAVQRVDYNQNYPFIEQLKTTYNTDILMSMHGSGLTHLLFLPKWAAVFEIYNCGDVHCYADLARLRGVKYFTWERQRGVETVFDDEPSETNNRHPKFANYVLDKDEFLRLVLKQIDYVRKHPLYREEQKRLRKFVNDEL